MNHLWRFPVIYWQQRFDDGVIRTRTLIQIEISKGYGICYSEWN